MSENDFLTPWTYRNEGLFIQRSVGRDLDDDLIGSKNHVSGERYQDTDVCVPGQPASTT